MATELEHYMTLRVTERLLTGIKPFLQRYQPIQGDCALVKDSWIGPGWDAEEMHRFQRYWCRQNWFSKIPYAEFTG